MRLYFKIFRDENNELHVFNNIFNLFKKENIQLVFKLCIEDSFLLDDDYLIEFLNSNKITDLECEGEQ